MDVLKIIREQKTKKARLALMHAKIMIYKNYARNDSTLTKEELNNKIFHLAVYEYAVMSTNQLQLGLDYIPKLIAYKLKQGD